MPELRFDDPDGTLAMLRDSVAALAGRHPGAASLRARRGEARDTDRALWTAMAEAGWTGLLLPETIGGSGLGVREQAILSEALGRALLCEPVAGSAVFLSCVLAGAPAGDERDRLAAGFVDGSRIIAPAWRGGKVTARETADGFLLSGAHGHVDQAASATDFAVLADTGNGPAMFSVPADSDGVTVDLQRSVDGAMIGTVRLDNCAVAASGMIVTPDGCEAVLDRAIAATRLALAAELAGIASQAVQDTIDYTKTRIQFGKPIASFQAIQHRLVDMWSDAEFAVAAVSNAVEEAEAGEGRRTALAVLAAKARAGDAAVSICRRAVHLHGAMGFTDECDIGLYLKRAISLNAMLGQPEELRLAFVKLERAA
ncbi:acyl-CoA dehydrogenase [Zhengella mangrovi]|uniref:Acyl-CoA dehydrogenase n=1 Tax=Zhengella mangrovi TaxID=1982044 RepID=A0A2G1QI89_9HYPH|nr:acyl-CoA dehydrogenase family protein [Zhengella mangrovi]PHP65243.1 acyl-CoA dehydrogenase [Zhengella mangrovi]